MSNHFSLALIILSVFIGSCQNKEKSIPDDQAAWRLGWRMIESSMDKNYLLAESQFDSLLAAGVEIDEGFLKTGLEVKHELEKLPEVLEILNTQGDEQLYKICRSEVLAQLEPCLDIPAPKVENEILQKEIIGLYVDDQAVRGNVMNDVIEKFDIDFNEEKLPDPMVVDEQNRNRLKGIFEEYGFPDKVLIGDKAMQGLFMIIQHSGSDKEWQKSQLENIEKAVKSGDLDGQSYAYLYDRIQVNSGQKQLYGTQFSKVDPITKEVVLFEVADIENLDNRRMEVGMMPIDMYKRIMLRSL